MQAFGMGSNLDQTISSPFVPSFLPLHSSGLQPRGSLLEACIHTLAWWLDLALCNSKQSLVGGKFSVSFIPFWNIATLAALIPPDGELYALATYSSTSS
jgi:hypothetical protein